MSPSPGRAVTLFEPLIDTADAARLLHIHPKTLQRFARLAKNTGPSHWQAMEVSSV
jgi:hypothetical protein